MAHEVAKVIAMTDWLNQVTGHHSVQNAFMDQLIGQYECYCEMG